MLNRDSIIAVKDFGIEKIDIPEWGGEVCLKKWSAKDRNTYLSKSVNVDETGGHVNWDTVFDNMVLTVALSLCDENGDRLFADSQEDLKILSDKDGSVIQKLYEETLIINGLAKKSIEEAAKN